MLKVLLVDDDSDLLEMVALALTANQMIVTSMNNGNNILESLSDVLPQVILMDIFLGDLDGRELCRAIKNSEQFRNVPVILYSAGQISASSIEYSLADAFINKPFDIEYLVNKIKFSSGIGKI